MKMNLANLYEDDLQMIDYMETSFENFNNFNELYSNIAQLHLFRNYDSKKLKLPAFHQGVEWINTKEPLTLERDLLGRIVVLDFFTYCCINCEHILPYLRKAEELFKDNSGVVMIGVHSPKFPNEKNSENLKNAILKNNIRHPVLNDKDCYLWNSLGVYCWPTVLILGPNAQVLFSLVGECQVKKLSHLIQQTLEYLANSNIVLKNDPVPIAQLREESELLRYPSYVAYFGNYLIVSDTGHNRLILLNLRGEILDIIGKGKPGLHDGSYSESLFNNPHGLTWWKSDIVFVADTGNHCIRKIDLSSKSVSTVYVGNENAEETSREKFSSPWDVCIGGIGDIEDSSMDVLYIAVAGSHQIWALYLKDYEIEDKEYPSGTCVPFAGSGKEECRNNLYKMKAGFAQPSGIAYSELERILYIADSESSSIRSLSLITGAVQRIAGGGLNPEDLFQFGDEDGTGARVRLQHPLAVCLYQDKKLFVSDTYNHKIKMINSETKECTSIVGAKGDNVELECSFQEALFNEPCGLFYINEECLLIVDTNNHSIKIIDFKSNSVKKMNISYPIDDVDLAITDSSMQSATVKLSPSPRFFVNEDPRELIKVDLDFLGKIECYFSIETEGISLTDHSPYSISFKGNCDWKLICQSGNIFSTDIKPSFILKCNENTSSTTSEIDFDFDIAACSNQTCICVRGKFRFEVKISKSPNKTFFLKFVL